MYVFSIVAISAIQALVNAGANARLDPPRGVWSSQYESYEGKKEFSIQLKANDWWLPFKDKAIISAGKQFPILDESCKDKRESCSTYTLQQDISLEFGSTLPQEAHHINIFLTDSKERINIYDSPRESLSIGCSDSDLGVCCENKEYRLERAYRMYSVYDMWSARPNGTWIRDGTEPNNFRYASFRLNITSGKYSGSVFWENFLADKSGKSSHPDTLKADIEILIEDSNASILDVVGNLFNNYKLLIPSTDSSSQGFVVPKSDISKRAEPLDIQSWFNCRSTNCAAPINSCVSQGPTPFPSHRALSVAQVLQNSWNTLKRGNRNCYFIRNGQQDFLAKDFSVDAQHFVQKVNCDYVGVSIVPVIRLNATALDTRSDVLEPYLESPPNHSRTPGTTAPPKWSNVYPSEAPGHNSTLNSEEKAGDLASTPESSEDGGQGIAVSFIASFKEIYSDEFRENWNLLFIEAIHESLIATFSLPAVHIHEITAFSSTGHTRLLSMSGTSVDTVVVFSAKDTTAALAFATLLRKGQYTVFSRNVFGDLEINRVSELNCLIPCGLHGIPAPKRNPDGSTACTCKCTDGWLTDPNQSFLNFKFCSIQIDDKANSNQQTEQISDSSESFQTPPISLSDAHVLLWRPPVYRPPPPPPKTYKRDNTFSVWDWIGVLIGTLGGASGLYFAWKSGCAIATWSHCLYPVLVSCLGKCCRKRKTQQESTVHPGSDTRATNSVEEGHIVPPVGTKPKGKIHYYPHFIHAKHPEHPPQVVRIHARNIREENDDDEVVHGHEQPAYEEGSHDYDESLTEAYDDHRKVARVGERKHQFTINNSEYNKPTRHLPGRKLQGRRYTATRKLQKKYGTKVKGPMLSNPQPT